MHACNGRYVLAGDVHQGLQLLSWRPERQSFTLVSRHLDSASAYACEFLLHQGSLHLILAEEGPTLRTLNYSRQVCARPREKVSY